MEVTSRPWSTLAVAHVRGKSRLITSHGVQPLKILQPGAPGSACHVVLSSYGGGLVAGDFIGLRVAVGAGSRLFLGTQANTKVFRSIDGTVAAQHTQGEVAAGGLAIVFPDPVVLQAESRYQQVQHWHLDPTATLLLVDWFHSGRMDQGERFAFHELRTELRVSVAGRLTLLDKLAFAPAEHIASAPPHFAGYQTFFSVFLIGPPDDARFQQLAARLQQQQMPGADGPHFTLRGKPCAVAVTQARENVWVLRAAATSRMDLEPLCAALLAELAGPELLGYNPLARKY